MQTLKRNLHRRIILTTWLGIALGTLLSLVATLVFENFLFVEIGFVLALIAGGYLGKRAIAQCRCPQCGGTLDTNGCVATNGLVRYICKSCRTHWLSPAPHIDFSGG